jgi:hypothetical protein
MNPVMREPSRRLLKRTDEKSAPLVAVEVVAEAEVALQQETGALAVIPLVLLAVAVTLLPLRGR